MQQNLSGYYVCSEGHNLVWAKNYISKCGYCGPLQSQVQMSRFKCEQCNLHYCIKCVKPPVIGDYCGGGHPMQFIASLSYHSCDVCRKGIDGKSAYRCAQCDYDVCEDCRIDKED